MNIAEISMFLGVSKKTIYRKIDKLELDVKGYVKQSEQGKVVTNEGIELIKSTLTHKKKISKFDKVKDDVEVYVKEKNSTVENFERMLEFQAVTFERTIADLKEQLKEKDRLIDDLRNDKDRLMQMQENSQVLLVREQDRVLMLEENKGFWSKFKKKKPNESWDYEGS